MSKRNEEILTATSPEGDTSFMVCKNEPTNSNQKVCMDLESQTSASKQTSTASNDKRMLDNNTYNLVAQLAIENKSLWRIKNNYKKDANMDTENKQLWDLIEKDKEEIVKLLTEKLRERL